MRLLVAFAGLVLGVVAGVLLLALNPLVAVGELAALPAGPATVTKRYAFDDAAGLALGLPQLLGLARSPAALPDAANGNLRIGIAVLPAGDGRPAALAVKASVLSPQNSPWRARLGTLDYWTIAWPGEGSVVATGYANNWALGRDVLFANLRGAGRGGLAAAYPVSALPPATDDQGVHGATGRYRAARGALREVLEPAADGPPDWTLALALDAAAP
jgi:hypothetical protein